MKALLFIFLWLLVLGASDGRAQQKLRISFLSTNLIENIALTNSLKEVIQGADENLMQLPTIVAQIGSEWEQMGSCQYALFQVNAGHLLANLETLPYRYRFGLAQDCFWRALSKANEIPIRFESDALEFFDHDSADAGRPPAEWSQTRALKTEWWMHCWERSASAAGSVDGQSVRMPPTVQHDPQVMSLGGWLAFDSPMVVKDPSRSDQYAQALLLDTKRNLEANERLHRMYDFEQIQRGMERFVRDAYSKPPYSLEELQNILVKRLGATNPVVRQMLDQVVAKLPPGEQARISARLAAAALTLVGQARVPFGTALPELPRLLYPKDPFAESPSFSNVKSAAKAKAINSQPGGVSPGANAVAASAVLGQSQVTPHANRGSLMAILLCCLAVILFVLWRASARGNPGRGK